MATSMASWHDALRAFPRAGPSLVGDRDMLRRAESKFVMPEHVWASLLPAWQSDFAVLPAGDALVASYVSVYFDTDDLSFFHAHRCGRRLRHKVRVRHYLDRHLSVLEVKIRHNEYESIKLRRPLAFGDSALRPTDVEFVRHHCGPKGELQPQAWVACRRITLLGLRAAERVTIDTELDVWRATGRGRYRGAVVVEVKQPRLRNDSPAMRLLRSAGGRPGWMSKYCTAIAMTSPDVRATRLLDRLRALEAAGTWTH